MLSHQFTSASCISFSQGIEFNNLLTSGGAGTTLSLCPNSVFELNVTVGFTAPYQEISTLGYPTDSSRAKFIVVGDFSSAFTVLGCTDCTGIALRSLIVNGNQPQLGYSPYTASAALINIGAWPNQFVSNVQAMNTRGWTTLHIFEGLNHNCMNSTVIDSQFGPAGGDAEETWADGISLACPQSLVKNNVVIDATDGGIVVFCAPGSKILNNTIIADANVLLGGINLVDTIPYAGNYSDVLVNGNTVQSLGAMIKVGIAVGPWVWSPDVWSESAAIGGALTITGATILSNTIIGKSIGYAIAASGCSNVTIFNNTALATFNGFLSAGCLCAAPTAFLKDSNTSFGSFQDDFVEGHILDALCVTRST